MPFHHQQSDSMLSMHSGAGPYGGHGTAQVHAASLEKRNWDSISCSTDSLQAMAIDEGSAFAGGGGAGASSGGGGSLGAAGGSPSALFSAPAPGERRGSGSSSSMAASFLSKLPGFSGVAKRRPGAAASGFSADPRLGLKHSASTADVHGQQGGGGRPVHAWGGRGGDGSPPGALIVNTKSMREHMFNSQLAANAMPSPSGSFGSFGHLHPQPHPLAPGHPSPGAHALHPPPPGKAPLRVVAGLGQGGYACVVQVEHTDSGVAFAMKVVPKHKAGRRRDRARLEVAPRARCFFSLFSFRMCFFA
jgi:hypothetical protein